MATKRSPKKQETKPEVVAKPEETNEEVFQVTERQPTEKKKRNMKWFYITAVVLLGLLLYWAKTNSWPVVAMVGLRPLTRTQVYNAMYKQSGEATVDSLITERLVRDEIAKMGVKISDSEVNVKIEEIRKSLGETVKLEDLVRERGMTMDDVKKQVKLQMEIEKAVSPRVSLSAEEIEKFVTDNSQYLTGTTSAEKRAEAEQTLRQQKLQNEITTWVEGLREAKKVLRINSPNGDLKAIKYDSFSKLSQ